jgi:hypothetical protein
LTQKPTFYQQKQILIHAKDEGSKAYLVGGDRLSNGRLYLPQSTEKILEKRGSMDKFWAKVTMKW